MRIVLADLLALLCGVAGWFYLFYSKAAARLSQVESQRDNRLRISMRRICGAAMFLLGLAFYMATNSVDADIHPRGFLLVWLTVMLLLMLIVILTLIDVRLTAKLRHRMRHGGDR